MKLILPTKGYLILLFQLCITSWKNLRKWWENSKRAEEWVLIKRVLKYHVLSLMFRLRGKPINVSETTEETTLSAINISCRKK